MDIQIIFSNTSYQIHLKLLEGRPGTKLKEIPSTLLDFTLARYIRFRFQGMHTTLNSVQWQLERKELSKRSFYSLRFVKIGARLDCNGHAQREKQYNDDEVRINQNDQSQNILFVTINQMFLFLMNILLLVDH